MIGSLAAIILRGKSNNITRFNIKRIAMILTMFFASSLVSFAATAENLQSVNNVSAEELVLPRSTLIVRGIEKSLTLYRDSIGMTLIYDQIIQRNGKEIRLIFLKTTEDLVGFLGLVDYEYSNPDA